MNHDGKIDGVKTLSRRPFFDSRGPFSKVYRSSDFSGKMPAHEVREIFWSRSMRGVVRGMHFQSEATGQSKLVSVVSGEILDVLRDVRPTSETFGNARAIEFWGLGAVETEERFDLVLQRLHWQEFFSAKSSNQAFDQSGAVGQ